MDFIDCEGFFGNDNEYIIKELCIMMRFDTINLMFKPPYDWKYLSNQAKRTNKYLSMNHHRLLWDEGDDVMCTTCITSSIRLKTNIEKTIFYILDSEDGNKIAAVRRLLPSLKITPYSISRKDLPNLPNNILCPSHHHLKNCAYRKCFCMLVNYLNVV